MVNHESETKGVVDFRVTEEDKSLRGLGVKVRLLF
jgi:hypothetical protein